MNKYFFDSIDLIEYFTTIKKTHKKQKHPSTETKLRMVILSRTKHKISYRVGEVFSKYVSDKGPVFG